MHPTDDVAVSVVDVGGAPMVTSTGAWVLRRRYGHSNKNIMAGSNSPLSQMSI